MQHYRSNRVGPHPKPPPSPKCMSTVHTSLPFRPSTHMTRTHDSSQPTLASTSGAAPPGPRALPCTTRPATRSTSAGRALSPPLYAAAPWPPLHLRSHPLGLRLRLPWTATPLSPHTLACLSLSLLMLSNLSVVFGALPQLRSALQQAVEVRGERAQPRLRRHLEPASANGALGP